MSRQTLSKNYAGPVIPALGKDPESWRVYDSGMKYIILFSFLFSFTAFAKDTVTYYGDGIRDTSAPWTSEFQGMCHDDNNYYITQRYYLWKIPKTMAMEKVKKTSLRSGVIKAGIPKYLKDQKAHHMGDCDAHNGLVFVPLEGAWPLKILVFQGETLQLEGAPNLPVEQTDAPWVTVDSEDGTIITGPFTLKAGQGLLRHRLSEDLQSFETIGKVYLKDAEGKAIELQRVQGVDFVRSRNKIWVVSDTKAGGLYGFSLTTGKLEDRKTISYDPGFPKYEELEGLDALEAEEERLPHYRGNLFVTMLNSNLFQDSGYLKLFDY